MGDLSLNSQEVASITGDILSRDRNNHCDFTGAQQQRQLKVVSLATSKARQENSRLGKAAKKTKPETQTRTLGKDSEIQK